MRNEIKILLAAIVVIIIVLVGAFALGGTKNGQASITPTPVAVTPTPTPIPPGDSQGGAAAPTSTPTVMPTATPTPTPTPTPEPASGRRLTEFGYWITYPPLGPETWSSPHAPPKAGYVNNTVFFDPTSADIRVPEYIEPATAETRGTPAVIHRYGDLNGTTTVGIYVIPDGDMFYDDSLEGRYYIPVEPYMTRISDTYYTVTFGPGVSERTVYIEAWGIYEHFESVNAADVSFNGKVKLDIVEVDDGYKVGSDHQFTLTVTNAPANMVEFYSDNDAYLWIDASGKPQHSSGIISAVNDSTDKIDVTIPLKRTGDTSAALPVGFTTYGRTEAVHAINPCTFSPGASDTTLTIVIYKNELGYDTSKSDNLGIDIADSSSYTTGIPYDFSIDCYEPMG